MTSSAGSRTSRSPRPHRRGEREAMGGAPPLSTRGHLGAPLPRRRAAAGSVGVRGLGSTASPGGGSNSLAVFSGQCLVPPRYLAAPLS
jgi:hypothetical protein